MDVSLRPTVDDLGWAHFKRRVRAIAAIDLGSYREVQMRRRLWHLAERKGAKNWADFARRLDRDRRLVEELRSFMTINVSEFCRQPERYAELQAKYLPQLLRVNSALRVWSAGCATGPEPYSLAIALAEVAPGRPHHILGTDIDEQSLARAESGGSYSEAELRSLPMALRARYLSQSGGSWNVNDTLRAMVQFRRHDLLSGTPPGEFDVIACRNVLIYFNDDARRKVVRMLSDALRPGGLLFVGGTELMLDARLQGFAPVSPSFYRKVEGGSARNAVADMRNGRSQ